MSKTRAISPEAVSPGQYGKQIRHLARHLLPWIVVSLVFLAARAQASPPPITVDDATQRRPVAAWTEILKDTQRRLTLDDVRRAEEWQPAQGQTLTFGPSRAIWWVRLTVKNRSDQPRDLVLDTGSTQQDSIDWYVFGSGGDFLYGGRMGDRLPYGARALDTRALALPLSLSPDQVVDVYLRLDTHDGLFDILPMTLSSRVTFWRHMHGQDLIQTLFHGGLLLLFALCLSLLLLIPNRALLYYTLYLLNFLTYSCVASGFDLVYLWPDQTRLHNSLALFSGLLAIACGNAFAMTILKMRRHIPSWLWRATLGLLFLTLAGLIPTAFDRYFLTFAWSFIGLALTLTNFGIAIGMAVRGISEAKGVCAGFAALIVGFCVNHFQLIGINPHADFTIGAIQLGAFIQIMIFAVVLAMSLRRLETEKMRAEAAARAKDAFLATMSHEIRTPLHAILGFARLGLAHEREPRQRRRLGRITRAGQHLLGIINDILDFSRIDGGLRLENVPFAARGLLSDIREMLEAKAAAKGLHLVMEAADDLPGVLRGDPLRLRQILLNFVNNAIKFSETGTIHVRLGPGTGPDGALFLQGEVADEGIGIDPDQADRLFSPFTQGDASFSRRFGGTGLGLAISKSLAELMGGQVGLRPRPGGGSLFWFTARVEEADPTSLPPVVPADAETPAWTSLADRRVLLVDDNELNRLVSRELLETVGLVVDVAEDGAQAVTRLEQAEDGAYDLVLMDMMMPVMDGLEATRRLRANPRFAALPIVAMTANAGPEDALRCQTAGMNAHLAKPIDEAVLWRALARLLPAAAGTAAGNPALFDPAPLRELRDMTTAERFDALLAQLMDDCEARGARVCELALGGDLASLPQEVHDLIGNAGNAGLDRLVALGQSLRQALRDGDTARVPGLAGEIREVAREAAQAGRAYFRSPEAAPTRSTEPEEA
jgi:signal transduction histidine kinase/DNA-binding NarL/FixJ family response regulator